MLSYITKHLKMLKRYSILSFKRLIEYRVSFYFNLTNQIFQIIIWMIFWDIILNQMTSFEGWDFGMIVLLLGFFYLQQGMWILFWRNWNFAEDIINGYITIYLVRPINSYLAIIWRYMDIGRIGDFLVGLGLVLGGVWYYGFDPSIIKLVIAFLLVCMAVICSWMNYAIVNSMAFWVGRVSFLRYLLANLYFLERMPLTPFPKHIQLFYTFVVPIIFTATYPTLILVEFTLLQALGILALAFAVMIGWILLFMFVWQKGLRRFESFGA